MYLPSQLGGKHKEKDRGPRGPKHKYEFLFEKYLQKQAQSHEFKLQYSTHHHHLFWCAGACL
jgi:hypothetical protein